MTSRLATALLCLVRQIPHRNTLSSSNMLPLWTPILPKTKLSPGKLHEVTIQGDRFVVYQEGSQLNVMFATCPHQAANLAKGWLDASTGCIVCPYHGFQFRNGSLQGISREAKPFREAAITVPTLRVCADKDLLYVCPSPTGTPPDVFQPPEEYDAGFKSFSGHIRIRQEADVVTENVLDMLHISYVHQFGNRDNPLPYRIHFSPLNSTSGRAVFHYRSGGSSISRVFARSPTVIVENEYHLPSTTVTRVKAGHFVKTVVTRALPINDKETILFYKLYRNFWMDNPLIEFLGTHVLRFLMVQTLLEDVSILSHVDAERRLDGFATLYDRTIMGFRQAKKDYM